MSRLTSAALTAHAGSDFCWAVEVRRAAVYVPDHRLGELAAVRDDFAQSLGSRRFRYVEDDELILFAASPAEAERFRASALDLIAEHGFFLVVRMLERAADGRWVRRLEGSADTAAIEEELLHESENVRPLRDDERALLNHLLAPADPRLQSLREQLRDVYVVDDTDWPAAIYLAVDGAPPPGPLVPLVPVVFADSRSSGSDAVRAWLWLHDGWLSQIQLEWHEEPPAGLPDPDDLHPAQWASG